MARLLLRRRPQSELTNLRPVNASYRCSVPFPNTTRNGAIPTLRVSIVSNAPWIRGEILVSVLEQAPAGKCLQRSGRSGILTRRGETHLTGNTRLLDCGCGARTITVGLADSVRWVVGLDRNAVGFQAGRRTSSSTIRSKPVPLGMSRPIVTFSSARAIECRHFGTVSAKRQPCIACSQTVSRARTRGHVRHR